MTRWLCGGLVALLAVPVASAPVKDVEVTSGADTPVRSGDPRSNRPTLAPLGMPKIDRHGDPLPPGAVARYGTIRLRHGPEPIALAFSHDGKILGSISTTDNGVRLWDPVTGKEIARLNNPATYAAMARDGSLLVVDESRCKHWVPTANLVRDLPEKTLPENTQSIAVNPDVRSFAAGSKGKVTLIDLQTGKHLRELKFTPEQGVTQLVYSPDGRWLAGSSGGDKTGIALWDLRTFKRVRTYHYGAEVPEFTFSPDSTRIALGGGLLQVYSTDSEELIEDFKVPETEFMCPRFSADGKWIYAMTAEGSVAADQRGDRRDEGTTCSSRGEPQAAAGARSRWNDCSRC